MSDIAENVRRYLAGEIDYGTFDIRQRRAWDALKASGQEESALKAVRSRLPGGAR